jgi:hypothetical protein
LRANETELGSLLWTEIVLPAFAACEREERDFGMETASEIAKYGGGFVVRVGGDVEDASGHTSVLNGFHSFGQTGACARRGRKLRLDRRHEDQDERKEERKK